MKKFKKYQKNLSLVEKEGVEYIKSYNTLVAKIDSSDLIVFGYWSKTTTKHINYVAKELMLNLKCGF